MSLLFSYEEEESVNVLAQVDELMEGRAEQQQEALELLISHREDLGTSPGRDLDLLVIEKI